MGMYYCGQSGCRGHNSFAVNCSNAPLERDAPKPIELPYVATRERNGELADTFRTKRKANLPSREKAFRGRKAFH
jgi:hypothetical protein